MMDEEFLERQFFVFDSDNLESITEKFYGYGFIENEIVFDNSPLDFGKLSRNGAFVYVNVDDINIKISQDYVGSYGLYYYQDNDYFAISNSFLKLMEYLRDNNKKITFNRDYADYYLGIKLCSNVYSCTLINEIEMLSKDIPITLSIGPMRKNGVMFYDWMPDEQNKYNFESYYHEDPVSGHYVTITGLMYDESGRKMLEISSWGRKYYINSDEYMEAVKKYSNFLFSNILYINLKENVV